MDQDIVIRAERPDQPDVLSALGALDDYLHSLYAPEANHIMDVQALLEPAVAFLVARQDGALLGTAALRAMPGEPDTGGRPYGEVKRMFVAPQARGQGLGARLLQTLEDRMRARHLNLALLETGGEQVQAVRLYERAGYARRGPFGGYPDNGLSSFYEKALP